nr:hypothetical protein [Tanacetum cinerariifolium]
MPSGQCKGGCNESQWVRLKMRLPAYWLDNLLGLHPCFYSHQRKQRTIKQPITMDIVSYFMVTSVRFRSTENEYH